MSARMQVPLSQRRHTNVAVVRYTRNGVHLEIACYKNKVISYRSGTEDRLDEVLQVDRIFTNVARGHVAPEKDVQTVFGPNMSNEEVIKYMLIHGELQVAQHERTAEVDEMFKDIALIISQKCINNNTQRPFPCFVIEQVLKEIGVRIKLDQPVKKQALSLIHQLVECQVIPISRANMKLRCTTRSTAAIERLRNWCDAHNTQIIEEVVNTTSAETELAPNANPGAETFSVLLLMQPNFYGALEAFIKKELPSGSTVHVVEASVMAVGESDGANFMAATKPLSSAVSTTCSGFEVDSKPYRDCYAGTRSCDDASNSFPEDDKVKGRKQNRQKGGKSAKINCGKGAATDVKFEKDPDLENMKASSSKPNAKEYENTAGWRMKTSSGEDLCIGDCEEGDMDAQNDQRAVNFDTVKDELVVQLQKLGLDPVADLTANGKDNDGRNKKKNSNKRKANKNYGNGNSKTHTTAVEQEKEIDSDEELEGNRKQRKKNNAKKRSNDNMEDAFDEGNLEFEEEVEGI